MKYVVLGAGPIGAGLAARLHLAGEDVWLIDPDKKHVEEIASNGLAVTFVVHNKPVETKTLPIKVALTADEVGIADYVVLSVKGCYTRSAVANIQSVADDHTVIISNQNGLGNIEILMEHFSADQLAYSVVQYGGSRTGFGKINSSASPENEHIPITSDNPKLQTKLEAMAQALAGQGLRMKYYPKHQLDTILWRKLATNCALNGTCALCRCSMDGFFACSEGVELAARIVAECCAVANKKGIAISPDDIPMIETSVQPKLPGGYRHFPSMVADLANRRETEDEFMNGAIVREGRRLGIETPYNEAISLLLRTTAHNYDYLYGDNM